MNAALGAGDLRLSQIINAAQQQVETEQADEQLDLELPSFAEQSSETYEGIKIRGVGNLLTTIASCCKPVPGDPIIGYITLGRGVSIHREDCNNAFQLRQNEAERIIEVSWSEEGESTYPVDIFIEAFDRSGLLRDVMMVLANEDINVIAAQTRSDKRATLLS